MKYIYISNRTKEKLELSKLPTPHILQSYKNIKTSNNRWGMFLFDKDKNEIVGVCEFMKDQEDGIKFLLLVYVFIDEKYRGNNQCYELVKQGILKNEKKSDNLIKVVIAGGEPILKCLIKVFSELKYKIHKYKSDKEENIKNLKKITFKDAIKIEKKNYKLDIWQTLFFSQ